MTEILYINSTKSTLDRIAKIDQIIAALYIQGEIRASGADIQNYSLNDGQTIISTQYTSPELIKAAISGYEKLKIQLENKLNGNQFILRDVRGLQ